MRSPLDGLGNGEAARYQKMRTGESSSTLNISGNSNVNKHASSYGVQQGAEQQTQPSELDSASRMEEITSDRMVTGAEKNQYTTTEKTNVPEQELPQYDEHVSDNWQIEVSEYLRDIRVGTGDANQSAFYDGNGKESRHDHNEIGDISTVEFTSTVQLGDEIDCYTLEGPITPLVGNVDRSAFDLENMFYENHDREVNSDYV